MSRKPSFANLRTQPPAVDTPSDEGVTPAPGKPVSREGRKQIAGFFTPDMSLALHMLARRQGRSLQALMSEAFDDVLRKHGESPIGE
ncbi:MAG TPA: ribbon-helix-helix domain-containing protein [Sphingomonas sp.]|jgi:hypothetical protein